MQPIFDLYNKNEKQLVSDYLELLKIPSVSADPAHARDMQKACDLIEGRLKRGGFKTEVWTGDGYPTVFGHYEVGKDRPTVLFYGHYDVQPPDPLDEWTTPPFEPTVRDGIVYARGAQDNKGQLSYVLSAVLSLIDANLLTCNVKFVVEGEEEVKSLTLQHILPQKTHQLKADHLLVVDSAMQSLQKPTISCSLRGTCALTVDLKGSAGDLHSGAYGGAVYNPNHALVEMLAKLRNEEGRVQIPGFYDGIVELTDEEKQVYQFDLDPPDDGPMTGGEKAFPPGERVALRPTCEINGIGGGYTGPGFKTVIPARAQAKISLRLVMGQDPATVIQNLKVFLAENLPDGIMMKITDHGSGPAFMSKHTTPVVQVCAKAYEEVLGTRCGFILGGGSIPITGMLADAAEADAAIIGVGLMSDQIHAPNEHFGLDRLKFGFCHIARTLTLLGQAT